ncbi:MAG: DNA double-strand break repair nuclease NurA [Dehalococcoidales bacterium]|jgi:hypothetical protein|nr:DNA double-strand break repair nuclease NurA [Dehalococcoidales bacterium]MDP7309907.1 DNA double-strand break repair nuclease NurA [Dehalococcoidales bacterium]MDP7676218.1 DNA double-strand break repair nuclease NurA [Dehalococcoidales bacterium]|tara:strand:- start:569 stop:1765 length:1197 start_codon:yes stop_codon:yes gene_type:complete
MALDLTKVATQVGGILPRLKTRREKHKERLQSALDFLRNSTEDFARLKAKINASKTTWPVAGLFEGLEQSHPALPLPTEFTIIASDGSQIDVDRHQSFQCYLINIGSVALHYGPHPNAILESRPRLYAEDKDLMITAPGRNTQEEPIKGALLDIKRSVEECHRLVELAEELSPGSSILALLDGSLTLWGLTAYPNFVADTLLRKGLLTYLDQLRELNKDRQLALASHISLPGSKDVVNAVRVAVCPDEPVNCAYCSSLPEQACDIVTGLLDRDLFANLLAPGERSELFFSQSKVVKEHYGEHLIYFFYLRLNDEIARVELPRWVAQDDGLLNLTHTLILDQCNRGHGYPVALSEAHEQAVVTAKDRGNFWQHIESLLVNEHLPTVNSSKSFSKRTRWI